MHICINIIRTLLDHVAETISVYTKSGYKTSKEDKKGRKNAGSKGFLEKKKYASATATCF